jgi:hypothetical protein
VLIALIDHLRCIQDHDDSALVAVVDTATDGRIVEGALGCPLCGSRQEIRAGVAYWNPPALNHPATPSSVPDARADEFMRLGALMGYAEGRGPFLLCGSAGLSATGLLGLAEAPIILMEPPDDRAARFASIIRGAGSVPLVGVVRGIALGDRPCTEKFTASCVVALAPGGRLVAPADAAVPEGIREIARDDREWVGEREVRSATVPLTRGAR